VAGGAGDQHLSYDGLDRLTLANGPYGTNGVNASFTYTYDELENLTFNSQVGTYSYPTSGPSSVRPHAVTTAGSNSYSYDANGNLTSGAGRTLTYNLENKPLTITIAGQTTTFVYDGDGGRVKKTAGTTVTRYISKLYECDNTSCSRMVFADGQRIATIGANGSSYYYHTDHLGSSSVITDSAGAKVQSLTYFPYGATRTNTSSATPAIDVAYKYTGKELDSSTNLYYYEARYYDPTLGRFLSADTIVPNPRDPQDLNRYTYAGNNPFRYTDPTGHFKIKFNKFLKRALGDVGTAVVGVIGQSLGNALTWTGNPLLGGLVSGLGTAMLTQSKTGRYTLAGEIIVATTVASFACGGCGGYAAASAIGAWSGAAVGGYSAAKNEGDLSSGILFGTALGAITGAVNGGISSAYPVASLGNPNFSWAFAWEAAKVFGMHALGGAGIGAANGATMGYAGGAGNLEAILTGTYRGAAIGAALGMALAGAEYYIRDFKSPFQFMTRYSPTVLDSLTEQGLMPIIETTALTVGTTLELDKQRLLQMIREKCNTEEGCKKEDLFEGKF